MDNSLFCGFVTSDCRFFTDSIPKSKPYISDIPRNHDSLFFVKKGNLLYEKGTMSAIVREGEIGYIAKGSADKSSAYGCDTVSYIAVNFNYGNEPSATPLPFDTVCCKSDVYGISELFENALSEYDFGNIGSSLICDGILRQTLGILYNVKSVGNASITAADRIAASVNWLKENYCRRDLTVKKLADMSDIGEKQFRRLFFSVYGKNPCAVIVNMRLKKAETLLLNNAKSISDIAFECGFSDIYSFSHCFKNNFGVSPKNFVENIK